jgi:epoxyqueuosine reductase
MTNSRAPSERLKARALDMGFNLVGITPAAPSPTLAAYFRWIEAGMHGTMGYLARPDRQARRRDLNAILPGARSLVIVGLDYHTGVIPEEVLNDPSRGRIAAYAWGLDYHDLMQPRLKMLAEWLAAEVGQPSAQRVYVDTGAILERSHAQQAGMGFIGKNTMLIHPHRGSSIFLGEIIADVEFDVYDTPHRPTMCGSCTRCLNACPTNAFPQPHVLDARRCISYLTIEHHGWIERELRPLMGNWVFGCDVCQEVCPFERFATPTQERAFYPIDVDRAAPKIVDLLALDDAVFEDRYAGTPLVRIHRERLVRNACIAAGNWGHEAAIAPLTRLLDDASPIVRGHATWAVGRILGDGARRLLMKQYETEDNAMVRSEIAAIVS